MIILIDLDGTLVDTAHPEFKPMKDGLEDTIVNDIPLITGAIDFISAQKTLGNRIIIVSDSHPKYVRKIAAEIFNVEFISLADKPNPYKTINFLQQDHVLNQLFNQKDQFILIGDSFLDIELGRRLNISTIQSKFYVATEIEERDGIGQDWKPLKMGPTYYAKSFHEVSEIISNPLSNLLAIEAIFQGTDSFKAVPFKNIKTTNGFTAFRCLARQEDGECDKYARADKYYQIDNPARNDEFLRTLAKGLNNYLQEVERHPQFNWDIITYVSDKRTTTPPNKMKEIFDRVECRTPKQSLFIWSDEVEGSLRSRPDYQSRRAFISRYLSTDESFDLTEKNIIIIDDQFTSSATAYEITTQLKNRGAKNILFIALFYLILPIHLKDCPRCDARMRVTFRREDSVKFYYCNPRGGCGLSIKA